VIPTPLPGIPRSTLFDAIRAVEVDVTNLRGSGGDALSQFNAYLVWANQAAGRLASVVRAVDIESLVTTPRYWLLQSIDPASRSAQSLASLVSLEVDACLRAFEACRLDLERQQTRWDARPGELVVADTSVYLHHDSYFDQVAWDELIGAGSSSVHLLIPLAVVDELDKTKRAAKNIRVSDRVDESIRTRARVTLRLIDELLPAPGEYVLLRPDRSPGSPAVRAELLLDDPGHRRLLDADLEIIDRAAALKHLTGRNVHLLTFDTGMTVRARNAGLDVIKLDSD
jgi:rRNA-processing protein FCF1